MPVRVARFCGDRAGFRRAAMMVRWLIVIFLALVLFSGLKPWLDKLGLGKLPGDFRFRLVGRNWFIPLTSSLLLSFIAFLLMKFL